MSNQESPPHPKKIDVLQMLRDAQGEAAEVTKAQQHLRDTFDAAEAEALAKNPLVERLRAMFHDVRQITDEAAILGSDLPAPYGFIVKQVSHWIDVADDAFKAIK